MSQSNNKLHSGLKSNISQSQQSLNGPPLSPINNLLSASNVQSIPQSKANSNNSSIYFDIKNRHPLKPIIYLLFKFLSFACNFNYAVENAVITMMMITFLTPNIIDSLVWIIPNIIAIIIRPYLIRYVHKSHKLHRMRSQAFLINLFLIFGAVGSFLVGHSGLMNDSKKGLFGIRILLCSVGWTLTGLSFQLIEYFTQRFKLNLEQLCFIKSTTSQTKQSSKNQQFIILNFEQNQSNMPLLSNYKFLGSLCGYLFVLILFVFPLKNTKKMSSFFQQSSAAYTINGFITLLCAITFYVMISYSGIPKQDPQIKSKSVPFKISTSLNYYLPGLSQLKSMPPRGLTFLGIHFMIIFIIDVMFIYTTMWTAGSNQTSNMKQSQANFYGMNNGVFYLLVYTFVYYGDLVPALDSKNTIGFKLTLVISSVLFVVCFWMGRSILFLPLIMSLAVFYKTYEAKIQPMLQEIQPQIKISKQLIIRIEKVAVLNVMPFIQMILLGRDDIQDCMLWCAILLICIGFLINLGKTSQRKQTGQNVSKQNKQQKDKIE